MATPNTTDKPNQGLQKEKKAKVASLGSKLQPPKAEILVTSLEKS